MNEDYSIQPLDDGSVMIDYIEINTKKAEFVSANIIGIEVGTTGHRGGDSGHGCRTYLKIQDCASTDLRVRINNSEWTDLMSEGPIEIALGGDCELVTFINALEFAVKTLKEQRG